MRIAINSYSNPMKAHLSDLPNGKNTYHSRPKKALLLGLTLFIATVTLHLLADSHSKLHSSVNKVSNSTSIRRMKDCDLFRGRWLPYQNAPYYTNETCHLIIDQQNCRKFGRPDTQFLKWRWKPDRCELPLFNAYHFLELVRGKSMAFVGDSVGRNQMDSLLCLLTRVEYPVDVSHKYTSDSKFKRWFYPNYKFTVANFWAPHLVKSMSAFAKGSSFNSLMNLYLDQVEETWSAQIADFDYVIISAGHWFFRPLMFYDNGKVVGCHRCFDKNIRDLTHYYGYKKAFKTTFSTLQNLPKYQGITFLRTFSPGHFENGSWDKGGNCPRAMPFTGREVSLADDYLEFYLIQMEEFRKAEIEGKKKGLKFIMIDTTEAMLLRPDGHPNYYGHNQDNNRTIADCVHWCLPGPIDTWNELLLQMLKMEAQKSFNKKLQKYTLW
ncbi:PC-Esterase [Dillenia turbinata]|uniref:PC-Esterase n=1 Tax=Dillenia turbinata TaxID=194707 RepID=A0AAN8ZBY7_9MAGN